MHVNKVNQRTIKKIKTMTEQVAAMASTFSAQPGSANGSTSS